MTQVSDQLPIIVKQDWIKPATYEVETVARPGRLRWWFKTNWVRGKDGQFRAQGTMKSVLESHNWPHIAFRVKNTADIKRWFRRLRPQEALDLQAIDVRIASLHEQLKEARSQRQAVLKDAWQRGHVVTWKELYEQAEMNESAKAAENTAKGL